MIAVDHFFKINNQGNDGRYQSEHRLFGAPMAYCTGNFAEIDVMLINNFVSMASTGQMYWERDGAGNIKY